MWHNHSKRSSRRKTRRRRGLATALESLEIRRVLDAAGGDAEVEEPTAAEIQAVQRAWLPLGTNHVEGVNARGPHAGYIDPANNNSLLQLLAVTEVEPNDSIAVAQTVPLGFGMGEDVEVDLNGNLTAGDQDFIELQLEEGDIFGANVSGSAGSLSFQDASGTELIGSTTDITGAYPTNSPLPTGGNASLAYVVNTTGTYYLQTTTGTGAYTLNLRVHRAPLESGAPGDHQILFIDFDGATIDASIFGGPSGQTTLSPLSTFLPNWGLTAADEDAVIDRVLEVVTENFDDIRTRGNNGDFPTTGVGGDFDIEILNSRDHGDLFGQPNVSRVIIGGSIAELGISTVGIAESIDVGNFDTTEDSVVLLDLLSDPNSTVGLQQYPVDPSVTIVETIGRGVGNIAVHEAGHHLGNWHVFRDNGIPNIMDQGGRIQDFVEVGPDNTVGTADDIDIDFGVDEYEPSEVFTGMEDTLNVIAFDLPTPAEPPRAIRRQRHRRYQMVGRRWGRCL